MHYLVKNDDDVYDGKEEGRQEFSSIDQAVLSQNLSRLRKSFSSNHVYFMYPDGIRKQMLGNLTTKINKAV